MKYLLPMAQADVLIITALKEEYDAVLKVDVGAVGVWTVDQNSSGIDVAFRTYQAMDGRPIRIALAWAGHMRTVATAYAAGCLIEMLAPRCLAMCGVCAGRRGKVNPGDVIIGSLLYKYDTGAISTEYDDQGVRHDRFQAEPNPYPLDEHWRRCSQEFKVPADTPWLADRPLTLEAQGNWVLAQLNVGEDPQKNPESAQRCPAWKATVTRLRKLEYVTEHAPLALSAAGTRHIQNVLLLHRGSLPAEPAHQVHVAPIATGDNVMRDPQLFDRLSNTMRTVLGVEMEAAAIGETAHTRGMRWVVMKAAMDFADHDKDDQFKPFAARASAECLVAFLRQNLPADDRGKRVSKSRRLGSASKAKSPGTAPPASITRKKDAVQKSSAFADQVKVRILSAFAGNVSVVRGLANSGVDLLLDLRTAGPQGTQIHLGVVLVEGPASVEQFGSGWRVSDETARDANVWRRSPFPVILVWRSDSKSPLLWSFVSTHSKRELVFLSRCSNITPAAYYDLSWKIDSLIRKKSHEKAPLVEPVLPLHLSRGVRDVAKGYYRTLTKRAIVSPVLGVVRFSWRGWRHLTAPHHSQEAICARLRLLPGIVELLEKLCPLVKIHRSRATVRGKWIFETRYIELTFLEVRLPTHRATIVVVLRAHIQYEHGWESLPPREWGEPLVVFESAYERTSADTRTPRLAAT